MDEIAGTSISRLDPATGRARWTVRAKGERDIVGVAPPWNIRGPGPPPPLTSTWRTPVLAGDALYVPYGIRSVYTVDVRNL